MKIDISDDCLHLIASFSNGDARNALSTLEMVINNSDEKDGIIHVTKTIIEQCTQRNLFYMIRRVRNIIISLVPT